MGYESPSPIQAATIPPLLEGKDVVGLAQTGTGKTAAFAVPVLSRIDTSIKQTQALVLAPTRELALQVAEASASTPRTSPGLNVLPIYGGQSYGVQLSGLRRGAHVVVGTPGRVIDHLEKGTLDLTNLKYLVLDEPTRCSRWASRRTSSASSATPPGDKQVALFSATMPGSIRRISKQYLNNPVEITVKSKTSTASNITQRYIQVAHQRKLDALTRVLEVEAFEAMIIFVRTKQATEDLAEKLRARGTRLPRSTATSSRHSVSGPSVSSRTAPSTSSSRPTLPLEASTWIESPTSSTTTSRMTRSRTSTASVVPAAPVVRVTRCCSSPPRERHLLKSIEKATRQPLAEMQLPSVDDVNAQRVAKFGDSITESLASENLAMFRKMIEDYDQEHDVPLIDIAAALALQSRDGEAFLLSPEPPAPPRREREPREPRPPRRFDDGPAPRSRGPRARSWPRTALQSASVTASFRVPSSVPSPTRVGFVEATSGTSVFVRITASSSCRQTSPTRLSKLCVAHASPAS